MGHDSQDFGDKPLWHLQISVSERNDKHRLLSTDLGSEGLGLEIVS
jgi:hypothetical protein